MERMKFSPEGGNGMSDICSKRNSRPTSFQQTSGAFVERKEEEQWNG